MVIRWQHGSRQLLDEWTARLAALDEKVHQRAPDPWHWLTLAQARILTYLIRRYGDDHGPDVRPPAQFDEPREPARAVTQTRPADAAHDRRVFLASIRPRIRRHLASLHDSNIDRYGTLPTETPRPVARTRLGAAVVVAVGIVMLLALGALWLIVVIMALGL